MTTGNVLKGLAVSGAVTLLGGIQTAGIGGAAAAAAFGIARWIGQGNL